MSDLAKKVIVKKVKRRHAEGHHGGSWKVAYADFVTAMMAFFLLLWLLSMVSTEKRAVLAEYFKNFSIFQESGKSFMKGSAFVMDDLVKRPNFTPEDFGAKFKKAVEEKLKDMKDQVLVDIIDGGVRIQIVDTDGSNMFPLGGSEPTPKARKVLGFVYDQIKDMNSRVAIEGHTDAAPFRGDQITNWELSTARASAARRELEQRGIEPTRIARVVGYADQELLVKEDPKDPRNRRISVILLAEHAAAPAAKSAEKPPVAPPIAGNPTEVPAEKILQTQDPQVNQKPAAALEGSGTGEGGKVAERKSSRKKDRRKTDVIGIFN